MTKFNIQYTPTATTVSGAATTTIINGNNRSVAHRSFRCSSMCVCVYVRSLVSLLLLLDLLVSCAASFCRLRQNFRALTSRIDVGSCWCCFCCYCCSGSVGAKALFFGLFVYCNTRVGVVLSSSCLRLYYAVWVWVSVFRIAWILFCIFPRWSLQLGQVKRLLCCGFRVLLSFVSLSLPLLFIPILSFALITCNKRGICQLEFLIFFSLEVLAKLKTFQI